MADDESMSELLQDVTAQTVHLVRDEMAVVRKEMVENAGRAKSGMVLLGGGGALIAYGTGAVVAGSVAALSRRLPMWAAALTVGGGLISAGGALAVAGRRELRQAFPLVSKESTTRIKEDALDIVDRALP
ncbi:phage holin family protein [Actinoallomurus rhizosphaericola]|uniref:phage holin family protein n=1 Tax=Actinoallomurus rhizosphaericola TaxID=2952536 RepID=UPI002093FB06|nr:phage holin family protein [Actinoallomurus rhizosphaericola]MCO5995243.1 phage holin family protein [Actinoallomurus rhizosphaericola]